MNAFNAVPKLGLRCLGALQYTEPECLEMSYIFKGNTDTWHLSSTWRWFTVLILHLALFLLRTSCLCKAGQNGNQHETGNEGGDVQSDSKAWKFPSVIYFLRLTQIYVYVFRDVYYFLTGC